MAKRKIKIARKALAAIMAVSMVMSSTSISAMAEIASDSNAAKVEVTGEGTLENPQVTTSTTTTVDPETGNTTITIEIENKAEGTNADGTQVSTESSQLEVTITDEQGRVVTESETTSGSETTIANTTETNEISSEQNVQLDEIIDTETGDQTGEITSTTNNPAYTEWTESETDDGDWVKNEEESLDGAPEVVDSQQAEAETENLVVTEDPLDNADAAINMTPGNTSETKLYLSMEELAAENLEIPQNSEYTDVDGNQVKEVVTEITNDQGIVIGYEVVKTTTEVKTDTVIGDVYEGTTTLAGNETIAPSGYTEGVSDPVPVYDADGNEIGTEVTETKAIRDDAGNIVGYEIIKTTTKTNIETSDPTALENQDATAENTNETFTLPTKPEDSVTTDAATGETTTVTVEEIKNEIGDVIGYKSTTVKTDAEGNEIWSGSESVYGTTTTTKTTTTTDAENTHQVTTTTTETTTVETTIVKAELESREVEEKTDKTTTTETTILTETDIYQIVETEDGAYFLYKGEMWKVQEIDGELYQHGDVTTESIQPNLEDLVPGSYDGYTNNTTNLRNPDEFNVNGSITNGYDFKYAGFGLESAVVVKHGSGTSSVVQFELVDEHGNKHYVLCADLGTSAQPGHDYKMENVETANYYVREGAAEHINTIALNGYWGTESGIGSLDSVKALLKDQKENGSAEMKEILKDMTVEEIDSLTDGQALAATQAAIWYYGNSNESRKMSETQSVVAGVYKGVYDYQHGTARETENVNTLYRVLLNLEPSQLQDPTTEFIDDDNFATSAQIVIKEKAEDADGNAKKDANGNDLYNTDLSFTIEMEPSAIEGNMIVTVKDQYDNLIATKIIAGAGKETAGTDANGNAVYTFENIELAEGVKLTLNLSGTQNLDRGVYLYTAEVYSNSQTFVGISEGTREVNLSVDMKFEVEEAAPVAEKNSSTVTTTETDVTAETKTDIRTDERVKTTETVETKEDVDVTTVTKVYADITVTEVNESVIEAEREWDSKWEKSYTYDDGSDDNNDDNKDDNKDDNNNDDNKNDDNKDDNSNDDDDDDDEYDPVVIYDEDPPRGSTPNVDVITDNLAVLGAYEILDEEVPLGNMTLQVLPMTGDVSVIWMLLSLLSGLALAAASFVDKKRKK